MLVSVQASAFKRDVKRFKQRGKDLSKLRTLLLSLVEERTIPSTYRDHPLKGDWLGSATFTSSRTGS